VPHSLANARASNSSNEVGEEDGDDEKAAASDGDADEDEDGGRGVCNGSVEAICAALDGKDDKAKADDEDDDDDDDDTMSTSAFSIRPADDGNPQLASPEDTAAAVDDTAGEPNVRIGRRSVSSNSSSRSTYSSFSSNSTKSGANALQFCECSLCHTLTLSAPSVEHVTKSARVGCQQRSDAGCPRDCGRIYRLQ
jgi:hypothetical protein